MSRNYTTISVDRDTKKVLDYLSSRGQSADGQIKELIEKSEDKTFEQLLQMAEEEK